MDLFTLSFLEAENKGNLSQHKHNTAELENEIENWVWPSLWTMTFTSASTFHTAIFSSTRTPSLCLLWDMIRWLRHTYQMEWISIKVSHSTIHAQGWYVWSCWWHGLCASRPIKFKINATVTPRVHHISLIFQLLLLLKLHPLYLLLLLKELVVLWWFYLGILEWRPSIWVHFKNWVLNKTFLGGCLHTRFRLGIHFSNWGFKKISRDHLEGLWCQNCCAIGAI